MKPHSAPPAPFATSTTLLEGLSDPANGTVWRGYLERYRPLVEAYARQLGVAAEDVEDVAQNTLVDFWNAYRSGGYDRSRGRLSSWLFGIATNRVRAWTRARARRSVHAGDTTAESTLAALSDEPALAELWERESHDALLYEALRHLRRESSPETMRAFELFALQELSAKEVARELDVSENTVFQAKRRMLARLRELLPVLRDRW